jgi:glycosyltransferase involved in cell wall biosynthesis
VGAAATRVVSVIVPCRNERAHIEAFAAQLAAQRLCAGWALEVVVADGASDDGTRERLADWQARDDRVVVVENPARIVAAGLNRALARARGEVVVRMDVHTRYADDYLARSIEALESSGA